MKFPRITLNLCAIAIGSSLTCTVLAANLGLSDTPLFAGSTAAPLTLMVMGRDHKLYYEAYNDASDLDGDGTIDVGYKPDDINYYGYFGSRLCYSYNSGSRVFIPSATANDKKCSGAWSGDFLNYLTTSRIDALRKVFYGGLRSTDNASETILERSFIPQDAHSWGKEYTSIAVNGYDIRDYTPLSLPATGTRHLFVNTTTTSNGAPFLRVLNDSSFRIWNWVSKERPVADSTCVNNSGNSVNCAASPSVITDYTVRNQVCVSTALKEENCQLYSGGTYKPVGILQEFGENESMLFGLLTGSYAKNTSGGVLRKNIGSFTDEINAATGQFTDITGIVGTIDKLMTTGFDYGSHSYNSNCGWITNRAINEGECRMWGNPIGEMMYEGLRYFSGKSGPTSAYAISSSGNDDANLGLPLPAWTNPYSVNSQCAKPFEIVISDINPSFDTDQLPGVNSNFGSFSGDLSGLNVEALANTISANEPDVSGQKFIGQVGGTTDGAPTAKSVTSLGNIRGLAPEEPTKKGGYYSASVAYYGKMTDINSIEGNQFVDTFSVALASPLPKIEIPVGDTIITLVPFAKSVGGSNISPVQGDFQPTNTIVDFYIDSLTANSGSFRINYEDVEQGADHDMDAIVKYEYTVNNDNTVTIQLTSTYAAGGIIQHMGYVISGTTNDGTYLEVRDIDTAAGSDPDYFLDTPPAESPGGNWNDSTALPLTATRTFTPNPSANSASLLNNPLWYAAKWGGYVESEIDANNKPDKSIEWDKDNNGDPDNYFLVTNALNLKTQLTTAFNEIIDRSASGSSAALNSGELNTDTMLYRPQFNTSGWTGELSAFSVNAVAPASSGDTPLGAISATPNWVASQKLPAPTLRRIITHDGTANDGTNGTRFSWSAPGLSNDQKAILDKNINGVTDNNGQARLNFIRGDRSNEGSPFRVREGILGDLVNSSPVFVGAPDAFYPESWASGSETDYETFATSNRTRTPVIYIGGNDGMLHGFNADTGVELMAYIPKTIFSNLSALTSPSYSHKFYADGTPTVVDAFLGGSWRTILSAGLNKGGQGIYTLDVTNPNSFSSMSANIVKWEFTDTDDSDLGYTYGQPAIIRMKNGMWVAAFGNGYNNTENDDAASTTGNAVLYIVNLANGNLIKKFDTGVGTAQDPQSLSRPNGMASPSPVDLDGDSIVDVIYAGDLFGNLWKIDVSNVDVEQWDFAFKQNENNIPFFVAKGTGGLIQPITSALEVGPGPDANEVLIYFGTGKYLETSDNSIIAAQRQSFYGVIDRGGSISNSRAALLEQTVVKTVTETCTNNDGVDVSCVLRVTSKNSYAKPSPESGWYLDLPDMGERVVSTPTLRGERILFVSLIPSGEQCGASGDGWLMELSALDGKRLLESPFDIDGDKAFTSNDFVDVGTTSDPYRAPVSGMKYLDGAPAGIPSILTDKTRGKEYKYTQLSSGGTNIIVENPDDLSVGRQSWRILQQK